MNRPLTAVTLVALAFAALSGATASPTFDAKDTLVTPISGSPYAANQTDNQDVYYASFPLSSTNHYVRVDGGVSGQTINVQYDLHLSVSQSADLDGDEIIPANDDFYSGNVTFNSMNYFKHDSTVTSATIKVYNGSPKKLTRYAHAVASIQAAADSTTIKTDNSSALFYVTPHR